MLAYNNDQTLKDKYVSRAIAHREADQYLQNYGYWKNGKGCAIGCLTHANKNAHSVLQKDTGLPSILSGIADGIFEGLPDPEFKVWPERFASAPRPGADLSIVFYKFMHWLLIDEVDGVIKFAKSDKSKIAIQNIADIYLRKINGEEINQSEWRSAAAVDAAAYAVDAAADAAAAAAAAAVYVADAAAYAADAAYAVDAAADAAAYAVDAAADAAAAYQKAKYKMRIKQADKLIQLMEAAH